MQHTKCYFKSIEEKCPTFPKKVPRVFLKALISKCMDFSNEQKIALNHRETFLDSFQFCLYQGVPLIVALELWGLAFLYYRVLWNLGVNGIIPESRKPDGEIEKFLVVNVHKACQFFSFSL